MTKEARHRRPVRSLLLSAALLSLFGRVSAFASEPLHITLQSPTSLLAGLVRDGTLVLRGRLTLRDVHTGVRVWSNDVHPGDEPGRYLIRGTQDGRHALHVRLNNGAWVADRQGRSMLFTTTEAVLHVDMVVDGDQQVVADRYSMTLNASVVLAE